jgi:hypothetical protein
MWSIAMSSTLEDLPYRMAALQFQRAVEEMEIWSANSDGFSFTISYFKSFTDSGFQGRPGRSILAPALRRLWRSRDHRLTI